MVRPPAQAPAAERHEAVGVLRPSGLAAPLPVRVSLRPLPCCEGWQEWPAGRAPGKHQQQGQGRQEPGEEGAQEGPKHPRPARPRSPPGFCCPSSSRPPCPSGFHQCPPDPPARRPPRSPRPASSPSFLPPPRAPRTCQPLPLCSPRACHRPQPPPPRPASRCATCPGTDRCSSLYPPPCSTPYCSSAHRPCPAGSGGCPCSSCPARGRPCCHSCRKS